MEILKFLRRVSRPCMRAMSSTPIRYVGAPKVFTGFGDSVIPTAVKAPTR